MILVAISKLNWGIQFTNNCTGVKFYEWMTVALPGNPLTKNCNKHQLNSRRFPVPTLQTSGCFCFPLAQRFSFLVLI